MRRYGLIGCIFGLFVVSVLGEPVKVMTYNVWLGFNKKQNLAMGTEWIASQDVDVLALQELKGFDVERLEGAAKSWGHDYAVIFDRKGGFPQGLTSKTPIQKIEQILPEDNPKLRGTLHCKTAGIHFFVVHFDPRNYLNRQKEAEAVAVRVKPLIDAGEKVVVLGDFNAHSRADKHVIEAKVNLLEKWREKEKEGARYRSFDENGELDYTVIQTLFDAGLIDPAVGPKATFPTRLLFRETPDAEFVELQQRIDFILVSGAFGEAKIHYPRDPALDRISDHYPVIMSVD